MKDFVIRLDLFEGVHFLFAALAHVRAARLNLLHCRCNLEEIKISDDKKKCRIIGEGWMTRKTECV